MLLSAKPFPKSAICRHFLAVWVCTVSCLAGGCGPNNDPAVGKIVSVTGRVFVEGEPLKGQKGIVTFVPNKDKGNATTVQPAGNLDDSGNYTLYYAQGKKGAPPGWYKVQVAAAQLGPGIQMARKKIKGAPEAPKQSAPFNVKFTNVKTAGLEVEVVESPAPGAYDLKLTK